MMMNLFNIFDPSTGQSLSLNWTSMMIFSILFPAQFWLIPPRSTMTYHLIINSIFKEFKPLMQPLYHPLLILLSLFMFILFTNFTSLFPYIFNSSSHMSFCMSLSFTLWVSLILFTWLNHFNRFMAHLVPPSTPIPLMPFMVLIELISTLIRPLTLSIRLTANMIAGHLLLTLIGSSPLLNSSYFMFIMMGQLLLTMLEVAVSFIQAYVFTILMALYISEI